MPKMMLHRAAARAALGRGVAQLAMAVQGTLGPKGMNTVIDRPVGSPIVSRDGVSIAAEVELACRFENMGAQVAREVSKQTNEVAGDGTTTATVLANALVQDGLRVLDGTEVHEGSRRPSPADLVAGIERGAARAVKALRAAARPLPTDSPQVEAVAAIAANDPALGRMVAEALRRVGPHGIVSVEEGAGVETELDLAEGMSFDRGYLSHHMVTEAERMRAVLEEPFLLLTDRRIEGPEQIAPLLEIAEAHRRPLLLIAEEVAPEAVVVLLAWRREGRGVAVAVNPPEFGHWRKAMLEDMAILTGGRVIARDLGGRLETAGVEDFGRARRVLVTQDETTILGGAGTAEAVAARRAQIMRLLEVAPQNVERDKLNERLAKMVGGTARLLAGGATPAERRRRAQMLDDAVNATRAALEEGVVAGGGAALVQAAAVLHDLAMEVPADGVREGVRVVQRALAAPLATIAENAGHDPEAVVERVAAQRPGAGFDARTGRYGDMAEAGVLDPVRVPCTAVRNAASIAVLILGTHTLIADRPEAAEMTAGPARGGGAELLGRA